MHSCIGTIVLVSLIVCYFGYGVQGQMVVWPDGAGIERMIGELQPTGGGHAGHGTRYTGHGAHTGNGI